MSDGVTIGGGGVVTIGGPIGWPFPDPVPYPPAIVPGSIDAGPVTIGPGVVIDVRIMTGSSTVQGARSSGGDFVAPTIAAGSIGLLLLDGSGAATVPGGYGLVALADGAAGTVVGASTGITSMVILSRSGGLTYAGGAGSIIATGGTNSIVATLGATPFSQFVAVGGTSTVTADNALVMTNLGAASINALSGNFVVSSGADTISAGAGPNTVAAVGSGGSVVHAGDGDLLFITGGDALGVQTILGGAGNETVFAGPKGIDWIGAEAGGSLLFIGGPTASTVIGGGGRETLFAGTGGGVFTLGSADGNVFIGDAASYSIVSGSAGGSVIYGNAGSDITFSGPAAQARNILVMGAGEETVNAAASTNNVFVLPGSGNATITASSAGGDVLQVFNQGSLGASHNIVVADFIPGPGAMQVLQFIGYGFNPQFLTDSTAIAGPAQTITGGNDVITLSDSTTITLLGVSSPLAFTHWNAIF